MVTYCTTGYTLALCYYLGATFKRSVLESNEAVFSFTMTSITIFYYYVTSVIASPPSNSKCIISLNTKRCFQMACEKKMGIED